MDISESVLNYFLIPAVKAVVVVILIATAAGDPDVHRAPDPRVPPGAQGPEPRRTGRDPPVRRRRREAPLRRRTSSPRKAQHFVHFLAPVLVMVPGLTVFAVLPWGPEFTMRDPGPRDDHDGVVRDGPERRRSSSSSRSRRSGSTGSSSAAGRRTRSTRSSAASARRRSSSATRCRWASRSSPRSSWRARSRSSRSSRRSRTHHIWFIFPGLVAFFLYFVSGVAETNRIPFDLPEAESELVAGLPHRVLGLPLGDLLPHRVREHDHDLGGRDGALLRRLAAAVPERQALVVPRRRAAASLWFVLKVSVFLFVYIWFRGTFPRYRFDQLMALGWKTLIPISLVNLVLVALAALGGMPRAPDPRHGPLGRRRRRLPHRDPAQGGEAARGEDGSGARRRPGGGGLT